MEGALMAKNFVSHTSASQTVDGKTGKNNKMERGSSVVANPIWEPGGPNSPKQRFESPEYANQTGDYGQTGVRETPENQHGISGDVEPAHAQPNYKGHDAG
tara:strand:- start:2152 stop:2454 length:303 start_codon:yes stop_codon:yes gene_type:complete